MRDEIRIGATGFAECALAYPKISFSKVRPFKFKTKGEGAGRSGYYKKAIRGILARLPLPKLTTTESPRKLLGYCLVDKSSAASACTRNC